MPQRNVIIRRNGRPFIVSSAGVQEALILPSQTAKVVAGSGLPGPAVSSTKAEPRTPVDSDIFSEISKIVGKLNKPKKK